MECLPKRSSMFSEKVFHDLEDPMKIFHDLEDPMKIFIVEESS